MVGQDSMPLDPKVNGRPIAQFHPSIWGDIFLDYIPYDKETMSKMEEEIEKMKQEVKKKLLASVENPLQQLNMIDNIKRLGVAYHFEETIEDMLEHIYYDYQTYQQDDLYHTSLRFRLLRQHGFKVSCVAFKESLINDTKGLLSLYEASHVRIHGEHILDQAMEFTTMHLNSIINDLGDFMSRNVIHSLHQPLHKGMIRLESRYYIDIYKSDPLHDKTLLKFAVLDFNFVQSLHRMELRDITRWWKDLLLRYKFARDRLAEAFFWTLGAYYEPQYSLGRKIFFLLVSIFDGTFEELQMLTPLIHRWDKCSIDQLPEYIKFAYEILIDSFEEFKHDLAEEGRAHLVDYVIEQMKILCDVYLQEARWRQDKCIPSYEEYIENGEKSFGYMLGITVSFLGMGKLATKDMFEWVRGRPKIVVSTGIIGRIKNDMGGDKFQKCRDHVASALVCYMKEREISEEMAREELDNQVEELWKDINEGMLRPFDLPQPLLNRIIELTRFVDVIYKGDDGYTNVSKIIKEKIALVLVNQISI